MTGEHFRALCTSTTERNSHILKETFKELFKRTLVSRFARLGGEVLLALIINNATSLVHNKSPYCQLVQAPISFLVIGVVVSRSDQVSLFEIYFLLKS